MTDEQRWILSLDPVAGSRGAVDATREGKRADCKRTLPHASDDDCERILQVDGRVGVKFIDIEQRFLRGQIDQDEYQASIHRTFIEHSIALEQFMSAQDFADHEHMAPGGDPFMEVNHGVGLPPGHKMGDEVLASSKNEPTTGTDATPRWP